MKKRGPRDESLYNKIQETEFPNFFKFVKHLTNSKITSFLGTMKQKIRICRLYRREKIIYHKCRLITYCLYRHYKSHTNFY